ncbi:hypothetical protein [Maribellus mangrovi]|uniref:hypothetical protein n=1 Tax=Maribellus mangrovi TaxID=3133146 RepID=UPI0030EC7FA6
MKKLIFIFILPLVLFGCGKESREIPLYEIPVEDRFIYKNGDNLLYNCSDGSSLLIKIENVSLTTQTWTFNGWFSAEPVFKYHSYLIAYKVSDESWNTLINETFEFLGEQNDAENIGYISSLTHYISTGLHEDGRPCTSISSSYGDFIASSCIEYEEISINNTSYLKVYHHSFDSGTDEPLESNVEMFWNLKYGIIQFKGTTGDTTKTWDLAGKI